MLKNRIIATLKFFDLQDYPLTLLELHKFLIADWMELKQHLDPQGELLENLLLQPEVGMDEVITCIENHCKGQVENLRGFYYLAGRKEIVNSRLHNYYFGLKREKLIRRLTAGLKYLPFVRGVGLAGSQAMGQQKESSDIDLFIIVRPDFMWLARTIITAYFQVLGKRRYGDHITNRFCLNHYVMGPKEITKLKNFYTASEYLKLRPIAYGHSLWQFQKINEPWLRTLYPNFKLDRPEPETANLIQNFLEKLLANRFGLWLDGLLKKWQLPKIRTEKFIVVEEDELSFHPDSKQQSLLADFFKFQKQQERVSIELIV